MNDIRPADVEAIDSIDDNAFRDLVVKRAWTDPANNKIWTILCDQALIERTAGCLDEIVEELTADVEKGKLPNTHGKVRQLSVFTSRLKMVNARLARMANHQAGRDDDLAVFRRRTRELAVAINQHRLACIAADLSPEDHDVALWDLLDELGMPSHGREEVPSLADMLAGPWKVGDRTIGEESDRDLQATTAPIEERS